MSHQPSLASRYQIVDSSSAYRNQEVKSKSDNPHYVTAVNDRIFAEQRSGNTFPRSED